MKDYSKFQSVVEDQILYTNKDDINPEINLIADEAISKMRASLHDFMYTYDWDMVESQVTILSLDADIFFQESYEKKFLPKLKEMASQITIASNNDKDVDIGFSALAAHKKSSYITSRTADIFKEALKKSKPSTVSRIFAPSFLSDEWDEYEKKMMRRARRAIEEEMPNIRRIFRIAANDVVGSCLSDYRSAIRLL